MSWSSEWEWESTRKFPIYVEYIQASISADVADQVQLDEEAENEIANKNQDPNDDEIIDPKPKKRGLPRRTQH
jgi:hypothetical protein